LGVSVLVILWQELWFASEYYFFTAQKELAVNNIPAAEKHLTRALDLYPANTEAGYRLGGLLLMQKDYKKSLHVLEKTLSAASYYHEVYYRAALASLGSGNTKKAVHYLLDDLKLNPYHLEAYKLLVQLLHENSIYADESSLAMMERGLKLFPYETNLWILCGEIYQKLGENEYAKNTYLRGLTVDTLNAELLKRLNSMYPKKEEKPGLLAQAQLLQEYNAKADKFHKMAPRYQQQLRADIEDYIQKYPSDTNGPILLARVLSLAGNDIKAKEELENVLAEYPDDLWANLALSTLYYKAEDIDKAKTALQDALFYYPDNQIALTRLGALEGK
jgi:Tfp pilus assembly protein PilF